MGQSFDLEDTLAEESMMTRPRYSDKYDGAGHEDDTRPGSISPMPVRSISTARNYTSTHRDEPVGCGSPGSLSI